MGQMRFVPPRGERISQHDWANAYVAGMEGIPWAANCTHTHDLLSIVREVDESGSLFIPYHVEGIGELVLSTASLMERPQPYFLLLELARGTVNRLRNQAVEWEMAGLKLAAELRAKIRHAASLFSRAAMLREADPQQCEELASEAIHAASLAIDSLGTEYSRQALVFRHQQTKRLATLLACDLGMGEPYEGEAAEAFCRTFNSASISINWRQLEPDAGRYDWTLLDKQVAWCEERSLRAISLGPIFQPTRELLPDWIYLWEDDFDQLQSCISQFLQQVVIRYRGRVLLWHCAAGLNLPGALSINEEQRLRLSVRCVEAVRQADAQTPVVISFTQPWAEYMATATMDLSPLHFADALVRADLGLAGLGLQLEFGCPDGPPPRDALEISQLVERWAMLGLPLMITTSLPSGPARDGRQPATQFDTPDKQREFVERLIPLLLAKQAVHGVIWGQLDDRQDHQPLARGIFDQQGAPKPALEAIAQLRDEHLC